MRLDELTMEQDPKEQSYVIFCDIDGVLANFKQDISNKVFKETQGEMGDRDGYTDERFMNDPAFRDYMWRAVALYQKRHGDVFWRDLELMPDAMELWNYIKPHHAQILTATGQPRFHAEQQKREWVTKHFGSAVRVNYVTTAVQKAKFSGKNHILIDDQLRAIAPWISAGGIGIHHINAQRTISELKKLGI